VRLCNGLARLQDVLDHLFDIEAAASIRAELREITPLQVLHNDIGRPALEEPHIGDLRYVLALDSTDRARLLKKAFDDALFCHNLLQKELDGDPVIELNMPGRQDDAHRSLPNDALHPILPEEHPTL
jgi:hypothetical protein